MRYPQMIELFAAWWWARSKIEALLIELEDRRAVREMRAARARKGNRFP